MRIAVIVGHHADQTGIAATGLPASNNAFVNAMGYGTKIYKIILSLIKQIKLDLIDIARDSELSEKELSNAKLKVQ
jgi:hypothetical protein